jgi:hypothetical protein
VDNPLVRKKRIKMTAAESNEAVVSVVFFQPELVCASLAFK